MTTFKKGERFIPHKPKENNKGLIWNLEMDKYNGRTLIIECVSDFTGSIKAEGCLFHPDWCEKVEEVDITEITQDLRGIMSEIQLCIELRGQSSESELKGIYNSLSSNVTKLDNIKIYSDSEIPNNHIPDIGKTIRSTNTEGDCPKTLTIDLSPIDWEQRRYELAKSAMQGILAGNYKELSSNVGIPSDADVVRYGIGYADEMIKQLKQQ